MGWKIDCWERQGGLDRVSRGIQSAQGTARSGAWEPGGVNYAAGLPSSVWFWPKPLQNLQGRKPTAAECHLLLAQSK